ncbi:hypothetical protein [Microcoleus sp. herbarium12]|uniref:hypothetical protein n=1 Tax=Microcoleus sp. herbarium12 TaxID=3055437 RepID=UPI002FD6BCDE
MIYLFWLLVVLDRGLYSTTWRSPNQKAKHRTLSQERSGYREEELVPKRRAIASLIILNY